MGWIFDEVRQCYVQASPEEQVRQSVLKMMIYERGFPKSLLCVEQELDQIRLAGQKPLAKRRADIVCFAKDIHPEFSLYPLLIVECKANIKLTRKVIEQVVGYNYFVGAYFIGVVNSQEIKILWYGQVKGELQSVDFLPSFKELVKIVKNDKGNIQRI